MINYPSVTFETKCWEGDWEFLLKTPRLERMITWNNFLFAERILFINNVRNNAKVCARAEKLVKANVLTDFCLVEDHAAEALDFFQLSRDSLGRGYVYSIAELVSIYRCGTEFLLHFSGDSIPAAKTDWVVKALGEFQRNDRVKVANPIWNHKFDEARRESFDENEEFFRGFGFSDQCYLVRAADFRAPIYQETHPDSARYPGYGGELFEKRVDSWMRNHGFHRITCKHCSYVHRNFPKNPLRKWLKRISERLNPPQS
jgi:hypothetical protein